MISVKGYFDGKIIRPLEKVNVQPETKVIITFLDEQEPKSVEPSTLDQVAGCLHYNGDALSIEDMNSAVAEGVRRQWK